ncbi:MAG: SDR family NAD(P)-dependent oxidoreductase [Sphingomonadales bacterium]
MLTEIFGLEGKVALVTGAGRGLGREAAIGLAEAGADVALLSRSKAELESTAKAVEAVGRRAAVLPVDLNDFELMPGVVDGVVRQLGRLDILVNNAAYIVKESLDEVNWDSWDRQVNVNLKSPFALCRAAVKPMTAQGGGKIINVTSLAAILGTHNYAVYAMVKAGLSVFTKTLAVELARAGINIQANCIGPGKFDTHRDDGDRRKRSGKELERLLSLIPMGRGARPSEVKGAVIFLASDASSYLTGHDLYLDGGWLAEGA